MNDPEVNSAAGDVEADALDRQAAAALMLLLRVARSHLRLILSITLAALLACAAFLLQRSNVYEARAQILVTPLVEGETAFIGLPILRTSPGDPTRTVETAAALISSPEVSARVAAEIGTVDAAEVRSAVTVEPSEESNVVDVIARTGDSELAAEIASKYAVGVIETQREVLIPLVRREIRQTRRQLDARLRGSGTVGIDLRTRLSQLRTLRDGTDPTLSVAQLAPAPTSPSGRPDWLLLALAGTGGLVIGVGTAILVSLASPRRIEDGADLFEVLAVPILSRLPTRSRKPFGRRQDNSAEIRSGYRLLRARLRVQEQGAYAETRPDGTALGRLIFVLGLGRGAGESTVVLGLATAITETGGSAILIDSRDGSDGLAERLNVVPPPATDRGMLTPVPGRPGLGLIERGVGGDEGHRLVEIARQAQERTGHVIIATASSELSDILETLPDADGIVLVVKYGSTPVLDLVVVADALAQAGVLSRAGYFIVGSSRSGDALYDRRATGGWVVHRGRRTGD